MNHRALLSALILSCSSGIAATAAPIPMNFESVGEDKTAIATLLQTYTDSVTRKNQAAFESLLLNKAVPFEKVAGNSELGQIEGDIRSYDDFRKVVFDGKPFTQRFEDVHVQQDGSLADVTLVFTNKADVGSEWGWKTLHLIKTASGWKIASEFFSLHPM